MIAWCSSRSRRGRSRFGGHRGRETLLRPANGTARSVQLSSSAAASGDDSSGLRPLRRYAASTVSLESRCGTRRWCKRLSSSSTECSAPFRRTRRRIHRVLARRNGWSTVCSMRDRMPDVYTRYVRSPNVVVRRVAGETILVPFGVASTDLVTRTAEFFVLNESAEQLWESLATASDRTTLARNLMNAYAVSAERAEADVDAFVHSLLEIGAIEPSESRD